MLEAGREKGSERREVMRKRRRRRFFLPRADSSPSMSVRGRGRLRGVIGSWVAVDEDEDEGRKGKVRDGLGAAGRKVKRAVFGIVGAAVVVVDVVVVMGGFEVEVGIEVEVEEGVGDRRSGEDMLMGGEIRDARRSKGRPIFFAVCRGGRCVEA
jgi:hypothetical protein